MFPALCHEMHNRVKKGALEIAAMPNFDTLIPLFPKMAHQERQALLQKFFSTPKGIRYQNTNRVRTENFISFAIRNLNTVKQSIARDNLCGSNGFDYRSQPRHFFLSMCVHPHPNEKACERASRRGSR